MSRHSRYLGPAQAASVYDRIRRWQDTAGFYEREAVAAMVGSARLELTSVLGNGLRGAGRAGRRRIDEEGAIAVSLDVLASE